MQLISQLEPHNRGAYGGCIGFIGLNGSLNQAITIRTFVSRNGVLWFQAGGGIVAKSNDEYELQEVNNKLGALKKAIEMAEKCEFMYDLTIYDVRFAMRRTLRSQIVHRK